METEYLHAYTPSNIPRILSASSLSSIRIRPSRSAPELLRFQNENASRQNNSPVHVGRFQLDQADSSPGGRPTANPPGGHPTVPHPDRNNSHNHRDQSSCAKRWGRKLPIINWLPKYTLRKMAHDTIAGLIVGFTLIPQGLAMAALAGLPAEYGLYSGFMGCFVYIFFGSTKQLTIGPTAIMSIMTLTYAAGKPPEYAVLLCFVTGLITLLMGLLQLGFIVNFVSTPVTSGFTSAAAIIICYSQIKAFLGIHFKGTGFIDVAIGIWENVDEINLWDVVVAIASFAIMLILRKLEWICGCLAKRSKIWGKSIWLLSTARGVLVMGMCTILFSQLGDDSIVGFLGELRGGLPSFKPPPFNFQSSTNKTNSTLSYSPKIIYVLPQWESFTLLDLIREDGSALIVLPFLALMEHTMLTKMFSGSKSVDSSQEMVAIGLSNICSSFFSSMPITGAFPRTGINHASGVETPMGGLVTGALVLFSLHFLTPWFYYIPKAALGAVNFLPALFTIDFLLPSRLWRSKRMDLIPWFATFATSLFAGLQYGVLIGFLISVVFLLYWAASPKIRVNRCKISSSGNRFILVDLDRSLTFPSAEYTRCVLMKCGVRWAHNTLPVVIDCYHIHFADYTAAQGVLELFRVFNEKNQTLILFRLKPSIERIFTNLMHMDHVPYKMCQTQEQLHNILSGGGDVTAKDVLKDKNQAIFIPPQCDTPYYDLLTNANAPTLLYPDTTTRNHVASVAFSIGDGQEYLENPEQTQSDVWDGNSKDSIHAPNIIVTSC